MKEIKRIGRGIGKVFLALLGGILMPILIWVALGAFLTQKIREKRQQRMSTPTVAEILAAAGITIREDSLTSAGKGDKRLR